jgi:tRNA(Arg) A34 adenosine deaminase TadA
MRAFLVHQGWLYHSESDGNGPHRTAVTTLIRGIWKAFPTQALTLLRNRIFTDTPLSPLCEGMIKVAAKRFEVLTPSEWEKRFGDFTGIRQQMESSGPDPEAQLSRSDHLPLPELLDHLKSRSEGTPLVSAVLLDPLGHFMLGSWARTARDRTAHAEVNLVDAWFSTRNERPPRGSTLHVSLRPCAMCAAQILALAGDPSGIHVVFHEEDPGPASKNSCLVPGSDLWRKAGSPDWRAWPADDQEE